MRPDTLGERIVMTSKPRLADILKDAKTGDRVATGIQEHDRHYGGAERGALDERRTDYLDFERRYYNLVTDFFEYGWGRSFHFAPRVEGESFAASLARHEHYMAHRLNLRSGMVVVDLGCGVGGPLREIARFSGAKIVGVNINEYQLKRAAELTEAEHLSHLAEYLNCDFMHVDAPDASFDAAYSIEATCCAPDKAGVYAEAFRLLKPGALLGVYEYCMTDLFDAQNPGHLKLKADMELWRRPAIYRPAAGGRRRGSTGRFRAARSARPRRRGAAGHPLAPAAGRLRPVPGKFPLLGGRAPADAQFALAARAAENRAARDHPGIEPAESRRRHLRRSRPPRYFHADVFRPRPQAGLGSAAGKVLIS